MVAKDALERRPDAEQGTARALVPGVGLELHALGVERLERVGQLEQLRLPVRAAALVRRPDPRPADLEPSMLGRDGHESGAADGPTARLVNGRERDLRAGLGVGPSRVEPGAQRGLIDGSGDRPAPDRVVVPHGGKLLEVALVEWLEPHARSYERDGGDPGLRGGRHAFDGSRHVDVVTGP